MRNDVTSAGNDDSLDALEALFDDPEFIELDASGSGLNVFEAVGMSRQELRHSAFLAFLLNPAESHGLGEAPLKAFLKHLAKRGGVVGWPSPPAFHVMDLEGACVWRERQHIDILVVDRANRIAVIIENKTDTVDHDNQLTTYYGSVNTEWPDHTICAVYLTPDGSRPTEDGEHKDDYVCASYADIHAVVAQVRSQRAHSTGVSVALLLDHYCQLLERHMVDDRRAALCQKLYLKHRAAFDLVFENRPDTTSQVRDAIVRLVKGENRPYRVALLAT